MAYDTLDNDVTMPGNERALLANRYRIVKQLGQGGMGSVWLAEDTLLDNKQFAVKMLPSILVCNKRAYRQLKGEALVAMKLTHQYIVNLRAFEENNGNPFLVMDYIDGQSLDDYLSEKGKLSEEEAMKLLKPIAAALDYAHTKGVVHRDVKPGNVMIANDGTPYILDFGIAREIQETMTRVTGKMSSGTLLYMSPEQLNGDAPTKEQDIYSFAAMAYECLKGEPPFTRGAIEDQIKNKVPAPLPEGACAASIMSGLAKDPGHRPETCAAVLEPAGRASQSEVGAKSEPAEGPLPNDIPEEDLRFIPPSMRTSLGIDPADDAKEEASPAEDVDVSQSPDDDDDVRPWRTKWQRPRGWSAFFYWLFAVTFVCVWRYYVKPSFSRKSTRDSTPVVQQSSTDQTKAPRVANGGWDTWLGEKLRKARERKKLTVLDVVAETSIPVAVVIGLERNDYSCIVAPIYGRGFVKLYCQCVGLDPEPYVKEFMRVYSGKASEAPVAKSQSDKDAFNAAHDAWEHKKYDLSFPLFFALSEKGYSDAYGYVGMAYELGEGVEVDMEKAKAYYAKSIEAKNHVGVYRMKLLYQRKNLPEAEFALLSKAAAGEFAREDDYLRLAQMLENGEGTEKDLAKSAEYYRRALNSISSFDKSEARRGLARLGQLYKPEDFEKPLSPGMKNLTAEQLYKIAVEKMDEYGDYYDIPLAFACLHEAVRKGHALAASMLSRLYFDSEYPIADDGKAKTYAKIAYDGMEAQAKGDSSLAFSIGDAYANGLGCAKDVDKAQSCYEAGAKDGDKDCKWRLGCLLQKRGENRLGYEYLVQAAEAGQGMAMLEVAKCLETGVGVEMNMAKAITWYEKCLKANYASEFEARQRLETLKEQGIYTGTASDETENVSILIDEDD